MKFNDVELKEETIRKTRKWFHDNALACIEEVKSGNVHVNDEDYYFELMRKDAKEYIDGKHDYTITFLQRAYYIQTGESVPILK